MSTQRPTTSEQAPSGAGSSDPLHILAWPARSQNPYVEDLYRTIISVDPAVTVSHFRVSSSWRSCPDVLHVHWPEAAANPASLVKAGAKLAASMATIDLLRRRGVPLVWTAHNLVSHEIPHPRLEQVRRRRFNRMVDGIIHLSEQSRVGLASDPVLSAKPSAVVPHGHFPQLVTNPPSKHEARVKLGLDVEMPVIGFSGQIRPYKNLTALIRAFGEMSTPCQLVIGGRSINETIRAEVQTAADATNGTTTRGTAGHVRLDDRWLSDEELATRICAADVVVLPYQEVHNSGVAILAVGMGRPVVVNPQGSMAGLGASVGSDWVYPLDDTISGHHLDSIVQWACQPRSTGPDLSAFDPDEAAARTLEFLRYIKTISDTRADTRMP